MAPHGVSRFLVPELLDELGDAVTVIDADWRYLHATGRAVDLIGRPLDQIIGAHVWDLFPEVVGTPQYDACIRAMEQRTVERLVWHFERLGGWFEQQILPIADGLVVVVTDVTERQLASNRSAYLMIVGESLASAATYSEINTILIDKLFPLVGAIGGSLVLADENRGVMRAIGWADRDERHRAAEWSEYPISTATPGTRAYLSGLPVFLSDPATAAEAFPSLVDNFARLGSSTVAALPLVSAGSRLGAMVLSFAHTRRLSTGDEQFLNVVAAMAAQAVLRAKLLETERQSIAALQRSLLPSAVADVPGLTLAVHYGANDVHSDVGGDWYDVIPLEGGAVGLVMGDVEGHDLDAAALMGLCRSAVRAYALEGHPPALVAARANILLAGLELGRMVTMSYTHLQPLERLVTVVSAGHPGTQVVAPDGGIFEIPSVTGPPLGVFESGLLWPETTSTLPGHALFAMFTDGLTEVRGEDIDVGLARVRDCLFTHRHEEPETLTQALLATRGSSHDDVAILAARLTENAQPGNSLTRRLPPTPHSVSLARRSSRQLLSGWGIDDELVALIELVISELASNAVRHTEHPIEIRLSRTATTVRVEVEDDSYRLPPLSPEETLSDRVEDVATGGRGLVLVRAFASRWGTQPQGLTKFIWAEFDLEPAQP